MSDEPATHSHPIVEPLQAVNEYLGRLETLPTTEQFCARLTGDLWQVVTGQDSPPDRIEYQDLTDAGQSIFGIIDASPESRLPWWLHEFEWRATYADDTVELNSVDNLRRFGEFDPARTEMHRPGPLEGGLGDYAGIMAVQESLCNLRNALGERLSASDSTTSFELPERLFEIETNQIKLTREFDEWLKQYFELLPGVDATATALLFAQTNTDAETAKGVLSEELYDAADRAGLVTDEILYNEDIETALTDILEHSHLLNKNLSVPSDYMTLPAVKYNFYAAFAETAVLTDLQRQFFSTAVKSNPDILQDGEVALFTRAAFGTPLIRRRNRPSLITEGMYASSTSNNGYYGSQDDDLTTIRRLFGDNDLI